MTVEPNSIKTKLPVNKMRKKLKLSRDEAAELQQGMHRPEAVLRELVLIYLKKEGFDVGDFGNDTIRYDPITEEAVIGEPERWQPIP